MRRPFVLVVVLFIVAGMTLAQYGKPTGKSAGKSDYSMTATYIEACSCDMFCPCYFNPHPTKHGDRHFCEASLVLKVDKGYYKNLDLTGMKVWIATDLGHDFSTGKGDWMALTFDPSVTGAQRAAMTDIIGKLYPLQFNMLGADSAPIEWNINTNTGVATARLPGGKGEVILERWKGTDPSKESVLQNVNYFGADSNTGFRMWKNKRHAYNNHGKKFEYSGTNGFLITLTVSGQAKAATSD